MVSSKPTMASPVEMNDAVSASGECRLRLTVRAVLAAGILGYLWFVLARQLSLEWSINPQYAYGWSVLPLAGVLAWRRWVTRPATSRPEHPGLACVCASLFAFLFLPERLVFEVGADWRLLNWVLAISVIGVTLCGIYLTGGRRWLLHFAFPVLFVLVAVPWVMHIERPIIQFLTRIVTSLTVECLNVFGTAAGQSGNVINTARGPVGVGEACSGIRSFLGTVMISLFLGELWRFRWPQRLVLAAGGIALAFVLNVVRSYFLAWTVGTFGLEALAEWHDRAGLAIFWASFFGLWAFGHLMREVGTVPNADGPAGITSQIFPVPQGLLIGLAFWLAFSTVAVEGWYRFRERSVEIAWTVAMPPPGVLDYKRTTITDRVREELQYDKEVAGSWIDPDGTRWNLFFFTWDRGPAVSRILARFHRPEICMPAQGYRLSSDYGIRMINCGGMDLLIRAYEFRADGAPVHVFFCAADDQERGQTTLYGNPDYDRSRTRKLVDIWRGERRISQQVFEIFIYGYPTQEAAEVALRRRLPDLIRDK